MPPEDIPQGPTGDIAGGPPWESQDPSTLAIVALSVLVTLAVLAAVYWFYFRDREKVTVESDEEKLLKILDEAGGKTSQPNLREETGWSEAKVSRVTKKLEEKEELEKLRLGRKNIIRRPENG